MKKLLACVVVATSLACGAQAADGQLQLSLLPGLGLHDDTDNINGLALNIWGLNPQHALAIGFINGSYGHSGGLSAGLVNYAENYTGVQWGLMNLARSDFTGWQAACLNYTADTMDGVQFGFVNYAGRLTGLQLGLLNMAAQADHGLQIGFVNLIPETRTWFASGMANEVAPVMVIANWRF